jgi:hypothetical protein
MVAKLSSPGHGAARLQGAHQPQLVLRGDPGEHVGHRRPRAELVVGRRGDLGAGHRRCLSDDAELAADRGGRGRVVTGDHLDRDAGPVAGVDGLDHLLPGRVDQTDQPEQPQVVVERRVDGATGPLGDREDPQPVGGVPVEDRVRSRGHSGIDVREQDLRSALHVRHIGPVGRRGSRLGGR